jgi:hypothetical protein
MGIKPSRCACFLAALRARRYSSALLATIALPVRPLDAKRSRRFSRSMSRSIFFFPSIFNGRHWLPAAPRNMCNICDMEIKGVIPAYAAK